MRPEIPNDHPIIDALRTGDAEAVKHHLTAGVSPFSLGLISGAIGSGNVEIIQAFLDHGFDVELPFNDFGQKPISRVIEKKHMPILKFFIEKGADVLSDPRGYGTPLHGAAAVWPEAIPVLLEAGASVNAASSDGRTPMMAAAFRNQLKSLEFLLAAGANLEDRDNEGTTPLILAARAGKEEAIEWLLDHGADLLAKDNREKTAEDWAKENGHPKIAELLQSRMDS